MYAFHYKLIGILLCSVGILLSCSMPESNESKLENGGTMAKSISIQMDKSTDFEYAWHDDFKPEDALVNRIAAPAGYRRTSAAKGSFADWLRHLPLKPEGSKVYYYNGRKKMNQRAQYAVVDIDTGKRDLQQCADAVMRLKAEYHYGLKDYKNIHFNYTNGTEVSYDDWRYGRKPRVSGNKVSFSAKQSQCDNSYKSFKRYMTSIFSYAGTHSLAKEMKSIDVKDMQIGDVFIQGGFPGHAVIVVDMAVDAKTGKKQFMMAQSYMPAQDMHVLVNPNKRNTPWYPLEFGKVLETPEWTFYASDLKRFRN